jgi:hypothetical protein
MSSIIPMNWDKVFEEDTIDQQPVIVILLLPKTCKWTLKRDKNGNVSLFFEDELKNSWDENFSHSIVNLNTSRFVPSKPMVRTHIISVFSWKFLPNNLGLGSIVFYGFAEGKKFQMYCGNNIKNTTTNPSTRVWDILNGSNLPQGMKVGADMFLAIELEEAKIQMENSGCALNTFFVDFTDIFKDWMTPQLSILNQAVEETTSIFSISKKYSALDGQEFILSPGEEFVFLDSDGNVSLEKRIGHGAQLVLHNDPEENKTSKSSILAGLNPFNSHSIGKTYMDDDGELYTDL